MVAIEEINVLVHKSSWVVILVNSCPVGSGREVGSDLVEIR